MNTHYDPYLPEVGEPASSSSNSPQSSIHASPFSSPVSTPASSVFELPKEVRRDPHDLPVFGKDTPTDPILYLPPFLSSLPPAHVDSTSSPTSKGRVPKVTDSRLPDIDGPSLALHKALHSFTAVTEKYASTPYPEAFNWGDLDLPEEDEHEWYCVTFTSVRKPGSSSALLYEVDKAAHEEAVQNGGLIMYWSGSPDPETGLNLSTCLWQSRADAIAANSRPNHIRAMRLAVSTYEWYALGRWTLRKIAGSRRPEILPYDQGTAGR